MRNPIYDNIKGIGILLVVLGHVWISPPFLQKLIYAFHMPMFFMLSGYLFNEEKNKQIAFRQFAISRFKRLYLPAIFIGFSCAVPSILSGQTGSILEFTQRAFGTIYSIPKADLTFYCTPIWFLTCLLCVEITYYLIMKQEKIKAWVAVLCITSTGIGISREIVIFLPLNLHIALSVLIFFYMGILLRKKKFMDRHTPKVAYICLAAFLLVSTTYLNPTKVGLAANRLGDLNYLVVGAISGSYLILCLAKYLKSNFIIGLLGQNTIFILGYNYWVYTIVDQAFTRFDLPYHWTINFSIQVLIFIIGALILSRMPTLNKLIQGTPPERSPLSRAP